MPPGEGTNQRILPKKMENVVYLPGTIELLVMSFASHNQNCTCIIAQISGFFWIPKKMVK